MSSRDQTVNTQLVPRWGRATDPLEWCIWGILGRAGGRGEDHQPRCPTHPVSQSENSLVLPASAHRVPAQPTKLPSPAPGKPTGPACPDAAVPSSLTDLLTVREAEVLRLIATGSSNSEIAEQLRIRLHTVKGHVASILAKIGVRDRTQAVIAAYQLGFVRQTSGYRQQGTRP